VGGTVRLLDSVLVSSLSAAFATIGGSVGAVQAKPDHDWDGAGTRIFY
jgi:hypothetical protein